MNHIGSLLSGIATTARSRLRGPASTGAAVPAARELNTRLLVGFGALGVAFLALTLMQTWTWTLEQIDEMAAQQTALLMDFDNSLRDYVANHIRPAMTKLTPKDEFIPEAMSTSYVSRSVLNEVHKTHPDYILRFPSTNPRNPVNKANAREAAIIKYFEKNPEASTWTGALQLRGNQYYVRATPRRFTSECLQCHGKPQNAPASLVKRYGPTAGFGRKVGEVSIDLVGMPTHSIHAAASARARPRILAAAGACIFFVASIAVLVYNDLARRKRVQAAQSARERRYMSLWQAAVEGFCIHEVVTNDEGVAVDYRILEVNPAYERTIGLSSDEVIGRLASDVYGMGEPPYLELYSRVAATGVSECFETRFDPLGKYFSVSVFSPGPGQFATAFTDVSERRNHEEELSYQSTHDSLTGLPNRQHFEQHLSEQAAALNAKRAGKMAVLFLDLDKFKLINDTLGHKVGDMLLIEVAKRLQTCLRADDVLARMGGDEFTINLSRCRRRASAEMVAYRILDTLSRRFEIQGHRFVIGASIGLASYPSDGTDAVTLLRHADAAMYKAKSAGRGTFRWYTGDVDKDNQSRVELERDLRSALETGQFSVYYQPILRIADGAIHGAEALLRWEHPVKGMISPSLFVPICEEIGLIGPIGEYVLRSACTQFRAWQDEGTELSQISVNVSTAQVREAGWLDSVRSALSDSGLPPRCLNLELTETDFAADHGALGEALHQARKLGVGIAIDDFGMGHSSLGRLKDFPVAHLKIDGSFVRNIERDSSDKGLLRSIIEMARGQKISVTAEWVETEAQMEILRASGCDYVQGYFISPPLDASHFHRFILNYHDQEAA